MKLHTLIDESRFIVGPQRIDAPLAIPSLEFGNVIPVELRAWQKSNSGEVVIVDLSTYEITLLVGPPNVRPTLGFWQITTTLNTSRAISARASSEEVATALGDAFGTVTVEGGSGSYIVTVVAVGIWALPTATFQGNTLSNVLVFQITPGTADTPAQYRIEVLEVAPARIIPADWTAGSVVAANSFTQVSGKLWQLILAPNADNGFFTLVVDGVETVFINFRTDAYSIGLALAVAGKPAEVVPNSSGGYWVKFTNNVAVASVGGNLVVLPFQQSTLDLTSTGVRELLDGLQFAPVKLSIVLVKDGQTITVASADVMLTMPINQPATITIDAPAMAGLTFAISDDGAYLQTYQNGVLIGESALIAPA